MTTSNPELVAKAGCIMHGWNNAVDPLMEENYANKEVYGLYDFFVPGNLRRNWIGSGRDFPTGFKHVIALEGECLHSAFNLWQYRLHATRNSTPAERPIQPSMYILRKGSANGNLSSAFEPDRALHLDFDQRFVLIGRSNYYVQPIVAVGAGYRDKNTRIVKALVGIAGFDTLSELTQKVYQEPSWQLHAKRIVQREIKELEVMLA